MGSFEESARAFAAFASRMPAGGWPALVAGARRIGVVVVSADGDGAQPWFALTLAALLRREGHAVTVLLAGADPRVTAAADELPALTVARLDERRPPAGDGFDVLVAPVGFGDGAWSGAPVILYETVACRVRVIRGRDGRDIETSFTPAADDFAVWSRLSFDVVAADSAVRALVAALGDGAAATAGPRPLIATSLAPVKIQRQQTAVASWIQQGFDVVSVNAPDEIALLQPQFPAVAFRVAARDARALAGKPLVSLDDVLAALRAENRALSGIVNSDIVLGPLDDRLLADAVPALAGDGLAFAKRMDQEHETDAGVRYDGGIDAFFFGRPLLRAYPATSYFLGLPWWDYFFAAFSLLAGHRTVEIQPPIAFHLAHKSFYDIRKHWVPLAIDTQALLTPLLQGKEELLHESGMDLALRAITRVATGEIADEYDVEIEYAFTLMATGIIRLLKEGLRPAGHSYRPAGGTAASAAGAPRLRLGLGTMGDGRWPGGAARIAHLAAALARLPPDERPHLSLVVPAQHADSAALHADVLADVDEVIQIGFDRADWRHPRRSSVRALDDVFGRVDFLFPLLDQALPGRPAASLLAEFEHEQVKSLFSEADRARRDGIGRAIAASADALVLCSHISRTNWQRLGPDARPLVRVLPWRAMPLPAWYALDPAAVAAQHGIAQPFLICCNPMGVQKGYSSLLDAVAALAAAGIRPLVVCTGETEQARDPLMRAIQNRLRELGIADRFRWLGALPRAEQMALMRASQAVIQPSVYEGWSLVVEEARALGKALFVSDLETHQEQAPPRARFFRAGDARHLAKVLAHSLPRLAPGPSLADEQQAREGAEALALQMARDVCALARETIALVAARRQAPAA